jgi:SAM-dependent methyltransferase
MTTHANTATRGSAERWGPLWGARPDDWALSENQQTPTYAAAVEDIPIGAGDRVLEVGCGVGSFLAMIADRGAELHGIDASEPLLELARRRVPSADLRVADMEALPFPDDTFDLVAGFNTFFFANDMVAALREARRVARPGAPVVIQVYGRHDRCELEAMKSIMRPFLPPRPADAPPDPDLSVPGALEDIASRAGLTPERAIDTTWALTYPDAATLGRAMLAPAGLALLVGPEREEEVRALIVEGLSPFRQPDGSYRISNEFRILVTRA